MKKTISLLLALAMCLCLCACGGGAADGSGASGSVSEKADAEAPAQALPDETGAEAETQQADAEREAQLQSLCGDWINFYYRFALGSDEKITIDKLSEKDVTRSENGDEIVAIYGEYKLIDDDGIPLLLAYGSHYIREQDYQPFVERCFVEVELTMDNVGDYFGDCVLIGYCLDDWGEVMENATVYRMLSTAYENGLVFLSARDFLMEAIFRDQTGEDVCTIREPYEPIVYWHNLNSREFVAANREFVSISRVKGTLVFVRAEYVAENRIDGNFRLIVLNNGMNFRTNCFFDYDKSTFDYESNKY